MSAADFGTAVSDLPDERTGDEHLAVRRAARTLLIRPAGKMDDKSETERGLQKADGDFPVV